MGLRGREPRARLVHLDRDRLGAAADPACIAELCGDADRAGVRHDRRSHRTSRPSCHDAVRLYGACLDHHDSGADRPSGAAQRHDRRLDHGSDPPLGPRRARRAARRHHAGSPTGRRDQRVPHDAGHGPHCRRVDRHRIVRAARHRLCVCSDCLSLSHGRGADGVHGKTGDACEHAGSCCRRIAGLVPAARSQGGHRLCLERSGDARGALRGLPGQFLRVPVHQRTFALYRK